MVPKRVILLEWIFYYIMLQKKTVFYEMKMRILICRYFSCRCWSRAITSLPPQERLRSFYLEEEVSSPAGDIEVAMRRQTDHAAPSSCFLPSEERESCLSLTPSVLVWFFFFSS